jgi:hypothetical protein
MPSSIKRVTQLTDVTVTAPKISLGPISIPTPRVTGREKAVNLDFIDEDERSINEIFFESIYPGETSSVKEITITNGGTGNVNLTLRCVESVTNPMGSALDTYLSTYLSLDQIDYSNSLDVTVNSGGSQTFYIRYQPPSTAKVGEKQWTFNPIINDTESGAPPGWENYRDWLYYDYFTVTGKGNETPYPISITIPYSAGIMNNDFSDIRFVNVSGEELGYYIATKTDGQSATFWLDIPIPTENQVFTIYVYSGNPNALSESNINNVDRWTEDWVLNDVNYPHNGSYYDDGKFSVLDKRIILCDGNYDGGNAVNYQTFADSFIFKSNISLGYESFIFWFYLADTNNYIRVGRFKRVNFGHYWQIDKVTNGTTTTLATTSSSPYDGAYYTGPLQIEVVKNTSIKIYLGSTLKLQYNGEFPQSGDKNGFYAFNSYWSQNYGRCYIDQPLFSSNNKFTLPTVSNLSGTWKFVSKNLEIKAGLLFKHKYLPGITPKIHQSVKIGGHLYD